MCSIAEPRRATVSCKYIFSSTNNERSNPTRRHNSNTKRSNNNPSIRSNKQSQKLNDITNENLSHSNVFHIPFRLEQINDSGKKLTSINNTNKLLRTPLNPLSPAFYSTRHISLLLEQNQDIISSDTKLPQLSETSDYGSGSGTDLEFQAIQHLSPQAESPPSTFDFDERSFPCTTDDTINHPRRISLSSSSSSSSSSISPSSSMSNLSSLSSSSELQTNFNNSNRLSNKKLLSINTNNNNNILSNESIICHCEKENLTNRKRNRFNSYPIRRFTTLNYCEKCQIKRTKLNSRSKCSSTNRQQKQRLNNNRTYDPMLSPIKFSIDLTGQNINYTIEYHDNLKCTCPTSLIPYYNSSLNRCKCLSMNDWSLFFMMNSLDEYNHNLYYLDANNNPWFSQFNPPLYNYNELYFTKTIDQRNNNLSSIYFDDHTIIDTNEHLPTYYLRYMTPSIEFECEENKIISLTHDDLLSF
jgi:hypothetical protein